jgi:polysaccharide deacetylase 2 family uncharacterized protein YibQ
MKATTFMQNFKGLSLIKPALPSFLRGVLVVLVLYALLFTVGYFVAGSSRDDLDAGMASEIVMLEKPAHEVNTSGKSDIIAVSSEIAVSKDSLPSAPFAALIETHEGGNLPKIGADGLTPFKAYKRDFALPAAGVPVIAFAVMDYGLSPSLSAQVLKDLPPNVSLLASLYADDIPQWVEMARRDGHEVWLQIPFETARYPLVDGGPLTILKRSNLKLNHDRLKNTMSRTSGYAGLWGSVDGTLGQADTLLADMFGEIYKRGIGYFETSGIYHKNIDLIATSYNAPYIRSTFMIDGDLEDQSLAVANLMQVAKDYGHAVGLVSPAPAGVEALPKWIEMAERAGIVVVPVSAVHDFTLRNDYQ